MAYALTNSRPVSAWNVNIDTNLTVSPAVISFATVFPGEINFRPLNISLSHDFITSSIHDDVEYRILQKPKPREESANERAYCAEHPNDLQRCYPSLCPYLSKEPDGVPTNDTGVPAFHDPSAPTSIALGRLAKSENDTDDHWVIDLHTPCFRGQCDQRNEVPPEYQLDPSLNGQVFGCDLVVEVTNVSYVSAPTRTQGFWKTHTAFTSRVFQNYAGGSMNVGNGSHIRVITNAPGNRQSRLFGAYYASIPKKTNNNNRSAIDQARMRLLQQLVTSKLNCAVFGCPAAPQTLIVNADSVYATGTALSMDAIKDQLDAYNNSGDAIPIPASLQPVGNAIPSASQNRANKIFWDNP